MRVVAGTVGGRQLKSPTWAGLRPTTDKVRGAIFNALGSLCPEGFGRVADLFAGTGANGIEALSRGATSVTFLEKDARACALIRDNVAACFGTTAQHVTVLRSDVTQAALPVVDVAIIDPPYAFDAWHDLLMRLPATLAVCESNRFIDSPNGWQVLRQKRYGDTSVTFLGAEIESEI